MARKKKYTTSYRKVYIDDDATERKHQRLIKTKKYKALSHTKQTVALLHLARNPITSKTQTYRGQKKGITAWAKRMRQATKGRFSMHQQSTKDKKFKDMLKMHKENMARKRKMKNRRR
jgi:6-phosphofructokinase